MDMRWSDIAETCTKGKELMLLMSGNKVEPVSLHSRLFSELSLAAVFFKY